MKKELYDYLLGIHEGWIKEDPSIKSYYQKSTKYCYFLGVTQQDSMVNYNDVLRSTEYTKDTCLGKPLKSMLLNEAEFLLVKADKLKFPKGWKFDKLIKFKDRITDDPWIRNNFEFPKTMEKCIKYYYSFAYYDESVYYFPHSEVIKLLFVKTESDLSKKDYDAEFEKGVIYKREVIQCSESQLQDIINGKIKLPWDFNTAVKLDFERKFKTIEEEIKEKQEDLEDGAYFYHFTDPEKIKLLYVTEKFNESDEDEFFIFGFRAQPQCNSKYNMLIGECHPNLLQKAIDGKIKFPDGFDFSTAVKYTK